MDGTRNPHVEGVALETAPIPADVDAVNSGGSYLYAGLFKHKLDEVCLSLFNARSRSRARSLHL